MKFTVMLTVLFFMAHTAQAQFAGGSGTQEDPYQVETLDQLQAVADHDDQHFIQIADIDATETADWNNGAGFSPIGGQAAAFTGSYDGDEHTIENLTISLQDEDVDYPVGLFGTSGGVVINLILENVDVEVWSGRTAGLIGEQIGGEVDNVRISGVVYGAGNNVGCVVGNNVPGRVENAHADCEVSGHRNVGVLVGDNTDGSVIINSSSAGSATTVDDPGHDVGGLAGATRGGEIYNSFSTANVTATTDGKRAGGLVGNHQGDGAHIENCWASGMVMGGDIYAGGLVGRARHVTSIYNSYSTGMVFIMNDEETMGGFTGQVQEEVEVQDNYWDTESSDISNGVGEGDESDNITGLTTDQMQGSAAEDNMEGLDFNEIWVVVEDDYPVHAWAMEEPTNVDEKIQEVPTKVTLEQNYPNPFNPVTSIIYSIPTEGKVTLEVYNMLGQQVQVLVNARQSAGRHQVDFDASDLSSGVYIYRLSSMGESVTRQMLLMK